MGKRGVRHMGEVGVGETSALENSSCSRLSLRRSSTSIATWRELSESARDWVSRARGGGSSASSATSPPARALAALSGLTPSGLTASGLTASGLTASGLAPSEWEHHAARMLARSRPHASRAASRSSRAWKGTLLFGHMGEMGSPHVGKRVVGILFVFGWGIVRVGWFGCGWLGWVGD